MLSVEHMTEEYIKCFQDKTRIYFIENYYNTYDAGQEMDVPFRLFPKQKEFAYNVASMPNNIILKPRQSGFSTVTCAIISANIVFCPEGKKETVIIVTNRLGMAKEDLGKCKNFLLMTPRWFWGTEFYHPDENHKTLIDGKEVLTNQRSIFIKDTTEELVLFNGCSIKARSSGPNAARGVSGATWIFLDEAAFIRNGKDVAASVIRAAGTSKNSHVIMISTPNLRDELYYQTYNGAEKGSNNYKITYLKWYHDPRFNKNLKFYKDIITKDNNDNDIISREWKVMEVIDKEGNVKYDPILWQQLEGDKWKATSPWYISECNKSNNDSEKIAQELECSFVGSGHMAVDPEVVEMQRNKNVSNEYLLDPFYEDMRIWQIPKSGHRYMACCDASRGNAGDNSTLEILDLDAIDDNGEKYIEQVAEFEGKLTGDLMGELAYKYGNLYNNALVVCDNTGGYGEPITLTLLNMGYPNLYYTEESAGKSHLKQDASIKYNVDPNKKLPGFHIKTARIFMVEMFRQALQDNFLRIRSIRVISELETWVVKNGKADHTSSTHDDTLMALSMGMYVFNNRFLRMERQKEQDISIVESFLKTLKASKTIPINTANTLPYKNNNPIAIFKTSNFNNNGNNKFGNWHYKLGKSNIDFLRYQEIMGTTIL